MCLEALAAAASGEPGRAVTLLESVPDTITDLRLRIFGERARCWIAAAQGRLGDAADEAVVAGRRAAAASASFYAADLLHDSIRFGSLAALGDLELLTTRAEGELVITFAEHGRALHDADPVRLEAVSRRFERMGSPLFAAEAAADAARAHRRAGSAAPGGTVHGTIAAPRRDLPRPHTSPPPGSRPAHAPGTGDRAAGRRPADEQRDRRAARRDPQDRRQPPRRRVPEGRGAVAERARGGARRRRGLTRRARPCPGWGTSPPAPGEPAAHDGGAGRRYHRWDARAVPAWARRPTGGATTMVGGRSAERRGAHRAA